MEEQQQDHYFYVMENGEKRFLRFQFQLLKNTEFNKKMQEVPSSVHSVLSKKPIQFVEDPLEATILNNSKEHTKDVHGIYMNDLESIMNKLNVITLNEAYKGR